VTVTTPGRYQPAFVWAAYLERHDALERLITPVNYGRVAQFGVSRARTACITPLGALSWGLRRVGTQWMQLQSQRLTLAVLDAYTARRLSRTDIFNGWSGTSLTAIQRGHGLGIPSVLTTGSAHIVTQHALVSAEMNRWGVSDTLPHPTVLHRCVAEYDEADVIVVPSRFVYDSFVANGVSESKLRVVPWAAMPVQTPPKQPGVRVPEPPTVLFVGGCTLRKGIPSLLAAAKKLDRQVQVRLVGWSNPELFARLGGLPPNVTAVGVKTGSDLSEEFRNAEIFVLPSIEDGSALVILEAMLAGLPVVVSDQAGPALIADGENGFIYRAGDSSALADRLSALARDPDLRRRLGRAAREVAAGRTPDVYGDELMEEVYRPLLSRLAR
jgi:glycosyltransferase involved in cell wall biosynthesis